MMHFDDFDAWGEAISGAHLSMACDTVVTPAWTLGILGVGDIVLQVAFEGGGNLCYGANTHAGPTIFVPLTAANDHVVNGAPLDDDSLLAIPRGADFSIHVRRRAHSWCSVALPDGVWAGADALSGSTKVICPPGAVPALRRLVSEVAASLLDQPAGTPAHATAGRHILDASVACVSAVSPAPRVSTGRPRLDRAAIIRRAMEAIDAAPLLPTAAELAQQVEVNERTLLRTFHETFGVPPKKYLMLRQLHMIRRILTAGAPGAVSVADVLAQRGIWEFGRFAGRYRAHFGELPSDTFLRARA